MTDQPQPIPPEMLRLLRLLGSWVARLASVAFGVAIEMKQVYGTTQAQWALVFLGLWFIGVPPALWFDGVWRLARIAQVIDQQSPPPPAPAPPAPQPIAPAPSSPSSNGETQK